MSITLVPYSESKENYPRIDKPEIIWDSNIKLHIDELFLSRI